MSSFVVEHTSSSNRKRSPEKIDFTMPPPRKVFRVGSVECMEAMRQKTLELSLPEFQECHHGTNTNKTFTSSQEQSSMILVQEQLLSMSAANGIPPNNLVDLVGNGSDDSGDDSVDDGTVEPSLTDSRSVDKQGGDHTKEPYGHAEIYRDDGASERMIEIEQDEVEGAGSTCDKSLAVVSSQNDSTSSSSMSTLEFGSSVTDGTASSCKFQEPDPTLPRFNDIIGHGAVKLRIEEVLLPMALPDSIASVVLSGIRSMPASILFYGPPGTGKTLLARAIAGEAEAAFISVGPSDILSKFVGESEASVRGLFKKAYEKGSRMESKCAVLFFDEIDALGLSRGDSGQEQGGSGSDNCSRRILAELLIQLNLIANPSSVESTSNSISVVAGEGAMKNSAANSHLGIAQQQDQEEPVAENRSNVRVVVVAATNRQNDCDPALLRRFGIRVHVGLPDARDRRRVLHRLLKGVEHSMTNESLQGIADTLEGYSGSDLECLTREAAMAPVRECIRAAALKKRQARKSEQSGGDSSREGDAKRTDPHQQARDSLLSGFQALRPVSLEDFEAAADFLEHGRRSVQAATSFEEGSGRRASVHYDSSSDPDEDDEE